MYRTNQTGAPPDDPYTRFDNSSMRGSGTARDLAAFFEESLDPSVSAYWLAVKKDNPRAIRFYEKQGFGYYKEEGELLYMIKKLSR